jgi:alanine dehydrogenase
LAVASPDLITALRVRRITAIAYETIEDEDGQLPVLVPASEVAGRLAPIIAGQLLRVGQHNAGVQPLGILLSGIPGVPAAAVVIIGGGVLGSNAARAFLGLGAEVTVLDNDVNKLRQLDTQLGGQVTTMFSSKFNLQRAVRFADVLVTAVLNPGRRAPILVTTNMVRSMRPGSVILDFSIDEGGAVETSRPTTLREPAFVAENVFHHCVPNITSAVPRTTSYAVTNAALPYLLAVGEHGLKEATRRRPSLLAGVNLHQGRLVHAQIASALGQQVEAAFADWE